MRNKIMRLVIMDHFRLIDWFTTLLIVRLMLIDMIIKHRPMRTIIIDILWKE
jgi:hypothetical protein